jgi:hypothetical protein
LNLSSEKTGFKFLLSFKCCNLYHYDENPAEALRRIAVVALEDAALHPSLPLVVWFMAAQAKVGLFRVPGPKP